jgi:hypothetical protein
LLIRRELTERAKDFNIILDDVSITELSFGKEYTAAVEAKQVAQQEAQRNDSKACCETYVNCQTVSVVLFGSVSWFNQVLHS